MRTKYYYTEAELYADIFDGELKYNGNIVILFDAVIDANIDVWDIDAWNINALNINAKDIDADDINALNINAKDIDAYSIKARNINAQHIKARDIKAKNIKAKDINAEDINAYNSINAENIQYYAVCFAYAALICKSIAGKRHNHKHFCLDGEIIITEEETHD